MENWYYVCPTTEQSVGPITIGKLIAEATLETLVWKEESLPDWVVAKAHPDLADFQEVLANNSHELSETKSVPIVTAQEEDTLKYNVIINTEIENKLAAVKVLQDELTCSLTEAAQLVETIPALVKSGLSLTGAETLSKRLAANGIITQTVKVEKAVEEIPVAPRLEKESINETIQSSHNKTQEVINESIDENAHRPAQSIEKEKVEPIVENSPRENSNNAQNETVREEIIRSKKTNLEMLTIAKKAFLIEIIGYSFLTLFFYITFHDYSIGRGNEPILFITFLILGILVTTIAVFLLFRTNNLLAYYKKNSDVVAESSSAMTGNPKGLYIWSRVGLVPAILSILIIFIGLFTTNIAEEFKWGLFLLME
jgi:ribosomal protein L7/L12